jgi:hypothetical protein
MDVDRDGRAMTRFAEDQITRAEGTHEVAWVRRHRAHLG